VLWFDVVVAASCLIVADQQWHLFLSFLKVVNNWVIVMEGCVAALDSQLPRMYFIGFWVCCVVITMNVLIAFLIDAYQAHVASVTKRVQRWEKDRRRRLHSQSSMPSDLRRSMSIDSTSGAQRSSMKEMAWQGRLQQAADNLGYDISKYTIKKEKGVGEFYTEMFKET
jgi:hypothetical protein